MTYLHKTMFITTIFFLLIAVVPNTASAQEPRKDFQKGIESFHEANDSFRQRPTDFERQQEFLLRSVDAFIKHAQILAERIGQFPGVQQNLIDTLETELQSNIERFGEFKERITGAQSPQELRELADEIREYRAAVAQQTVRKLMLLAHTGMLEHRILEIASARADSIQERLGEFETLGKDITELEKLLTHAQETIAEASEELHVLKQNIVENDIDVAFMQDIQKTLHSVKTKVKNTYSIFRSIAKEAAEL